MTNEDYNKRLHSIINDAFNLLEEKIAHGGIKARNEASFQLELAYILKVIGKLHEFKSDEKFYMELEKPMTLTTISKKNNSKKARVDIYLEFGTSKNKSSAAIELKYLKKSNHAEPNNRYNLFSDLYNLEDYKTQKVDLCYFYVGTDHSHYVNQQNYSTNTMDFDMRNGKKYVAGTKLVYRTDTPQGSPIILKNNYEFKWNKPINNVELYFMRVTV